MIRPLPLSWQATEQTSDEWDSVYRVVLIFWFSRQGCGELTFLERSLEFTS